jgi:ubiquitin C-terminal hydrolase
MSALVVSMSSINPAFAGEFKSEEHEDDQFTPPEPRESYLLANAAAATSSSPNCSTLRLHSQLDGSEEEDEEDPSLVIVALQDSTEENSYVLVHKPVDQPVDEPLLDESNIDSVPSIPEMDMKIKMGDDIPLPPAHAPSDESEASPFVADTALLLLNLPSVAEPPLHHKLPYGGLQNLGNTCYLNSALQMLASLGIFSKTLNEHEPEHVDSALRMELLSVLQRLGQGETVQPDSFKNQVDERSPLFIGYRQQDAHEFLTTLLDLLDEDYKTIPRAEDDRDEEMKDAEEDADEDISCKNDNNEMQQDGGDLPVKKQRLDAAEIAAPWSISPAEVPSLPSAGSFKDLEFGDIESLLHGDKTESLASTTLSGSKGPTGPKCKLIGGRMNTSGVQLTKWGEDGNIEASSGLKNLSEEDNASDALQDTKPYSPIDANFTTEVRVCLTCDSCKYRRSHTETYLHLSLEIGPSIGSIEEGIRAFFKPEKRDVKCEKCFCETASQTTEITKLPQAMLFHLKRFIVDISPDYSNISYRKDQSAVSFTPTLEIDEHSGVLGEVVAVNEVTLPIDSRYSIRSVVNHIGSSASCGHYTADAVKQGEWIRFNDDYVSKISESFAVENAASTAYMVLYELESIYEQ